MNTAEYHFEYCGLCGDELENDQEFDTGCCDDCADLGPDYDVERISHPMQAIQIIVDEGVPTIEFPDGAKVRLNLHLREWTHESPKSGEEIPLRVETDGNDFRWWMAYPKRSEETVGTLREDFPQLTIEPEVHAPDRDGDASDPDDETNEIQQYCVHPGCTWTDSWEGGSVADDPAIDHLEDNTDHTVKSGVADYHTGFYEMQRAGELDVTREMVEIVERVQDGDGDE